MPLTTAEEVGKVIEVDTDIDLDPFINAADELVMEVCANSGYSDIRLQMIETWLAAHFYAAGLNPQALTEGVSGLTAQYQSRVDLGLNVTHYGQQAMRLDTKGNLAAMENSMKTVKSTLPAGQVTPKVTWLGTDDWGV